MNLKVKIGGFEFQNPVTVASGTFWYTDTFYTQNEVRQLGAIVPKTVTLNKREGNPPPRICETPSGMVNAIGIDNDGVDDFIKKKLPELQDLNVPVIASVMGNSIEEFCQLAQRFSGQKNVVALECNLSCPNLQKKVLTAQDPGLAADTIKAVKKATSLPVIAKLTPNVTDITAVALAVEEGGADALSLINTLGAMVIDIKRRKPCLGNISGGLSGPAIRPVAVKMVYDTARAVRIPIIGMGGIMTTNDALEFLMAGATMVAVGTGNFVNPEAPFEILSGLEKFMEANGMTDIGELIGCAN
ncbi:MAG: dihydroorotate dehydrogenase [Candidatus Omnitrophota bacterium]